MSKFISSLILIFSILVFNGCSQNIPEADLVIKNGKVVTMADDFSEAQAIAVIGDTIAAVGTNSEIDEYVGAKTKIIDLNGEMVIPGFIDSHAHLLGLGKSLINLNLKNAQTWDEIIYMVAEAAEKTKPGDWIIGRGWHQEKWLTKPVPTIDGYPVHNSLSDATKRNPVILTHASGHALFANEYAMRLAGIADSTADPEGGRIVRDTLTGKATGVFEENAEDLIFQKYLADTKTGNKEKLRAIELAENECLKYGITTLHDAGSTFDEIDFLKELADSNKLNIRLYVMIGDSLPALKQNIANYKLIGYGNNFLTVRAIKKYVDGALGSRGAWLLDEYSDLPGHFGQNVTEIPELEETAEIAAKYGFQLCTHAIGDRGNREMLNIYSDVLGEYEDGNSRRWRIEHAQHLNPLEIGRFSDLGIIAAMQGIHCTSDAVFVVQRLGKERAESGAYVWRKLIDKGTVICNGTDAPVESVNTFENYYALVTRALSDGTTFYPNQKMTRIEALKAYTYNGAYAAFEENIKGSLRTGKLADIAILSKDLLTIPDDDITSTEVLYSIVGGKVKYERN